MSKYDVTMFRVAADVMRGIISVEADSPEEAKSKAIERYKNEPLIIDWNCEEPGWADDGWLVSEFQVEEIPDSETAT